MPTILATPLTDFAARLLAAGGLPADEAQLIAVSLVGSNLRGHDSHGVMRVPSYLEACRKGEVMPGATFTILQSTDSLLAADANWGFGQPQAQRLTQRLIEMATQSGLAVGTMIRSSHVGRLGEYCEMAAQAGFVSQMMVNTHGHARRVAPPGGKAPRLGTNPIALGAPAPGGPLILDFGTSATAEGKVRLKRIAGERCPPGWLLDSEGRPTQDPTTLYGEPPGTILPLGGDQSYKGFGLALMIEIFAGALSGGACVREVPKNQNGNCVFMLLVDPARLGGAEHFACEVSDLAQFVRDCPTIEPGAPILLPGDIERRTMARRSSEGIPFDDGNWKQLSDLATRLHVEVPA